MFCTDLNIILNVKIQSNAGIQLVDSSFKVLQVIQGFTQVCKEIPATGTQNIHLDMKTGLLFSVGIPGHLQFYEPIKDSHVFNVSQGQLRN